jgi:hypothetical protein
MTMNNMYTFDTAKLINVIPDFMIQLKKVSVGINLVIFIIF